MIEQAALLSIARECGANDSYGLDSTVDMSEKALAAFASRIRSDALEEAAKIAESYVDKQLEHHPELHILRANSHGYLIASEIRLAGEVG